MKTITNPINDALSCAATALRAYSVDTSADDLRMEAYESVSDLHVALRGQPEHAVGHDAALDLALALSDERGTSFNTDDTRALADKWTAYRPTELAA